MLRKANEGLVDEFYPAFSPRDTSNSPRWDQSSYAGSKWSSKSPSKESTQADGFGFTTSSSGPVLGEKFKGAKFADVHPWADMEPSESARFVAREDQIVQEMSETELDERLQKFQRKREACLKAEKERERQLRHEQLSQFREEKRLRLEARDEHGDEWRRPLEESWRDTILTKRRSQPRDIYTKIDKSIYDHHEFAAAARSGVFGEVLQESYRSPRQQHSVYGLMPAGPFKKIMAETVG